MAEEDNRARLKRWLESGEARLHPLSFPQRELWENSPVPAGDPANHICASIEIKGGITREECEAALQKVIDRHEVMRLSVLPGKDRPVHMIRSTGTASLGFRQLSAAESQPAALESLMQDVSARPFDLLQGPLYRVEMMQRSTSDHILAFSIHHAIADGWSLGVFVQDLSTAYVMGLKGLRRAVATGVMKLNDSLPPVPQTHSAWAAAERAFWQPPELERRAGFWKSQLDGSRRLWHHHDGSARGTGPLARCVCSLPANLTRSIKDLAVKNGATLFSTLLAGFQVALEKWTGQDDTVVGTPVANRNKEVVRQTMGYFAGIVPLRGQLDRRMTFSQHLASVHNRAVDCFAHAMPFAELARTLGAPSGPGQHSIFDVRFALQNHPVPDVVLPRISTRLRMRSTGTARFDLACEITETGAEMEVVWLHREAMISRKEVMDLDGLFRSVLVRISQNPESRLDAAIVSHS